MHREAGIFTGGGPPGPPFEPPLSRPTVLAALSQRKIRNRLNREVIALKSVNPDAYTIHWCSTYSSKNCSENGSVSVAYA